MSSASAIKKLSSLIIWFTLIASSINVARAGESAVRWTMFDVVGTVGQADCHLLQFPDGSNVLIDVADGVDVPGAALTHLNKLHIQRLSLVVISHFHKDHYGRLIDLLNAGIRVDRVVLNVPDKKVPIARFRGGPTGRIFRRPSVNFALAAFLSPLRRQEIEFLRRNRTTGLPPT